MSLVLLLVACSHPLPEMADNSLEASSARPRGDAWEAEGAAAVTAGEAEGDWVLTVGAETYDVHSPSRAALDAFDGLPLRIAVEEPFGGWIGGVTLHHGDDLVYAADASGGPFEEVSWAYGAALGEGTAAGSDVVFHEVLVHADDGDVVALPGEPVEVLLHGAAYRLTAAASYRIAYEPGEPVPGCGPSDLLLVEIVRTEAPVDEAPLLRPAALAGASASCN